MPPKPGPQGRRERALPLKPMFAKLDKDKSGYLDRKEVRKLLDVLGLVLLDSEFEEAWAAVDQDGSGEVNFQEFESWFWLTQVCSLVVLARVLECLLSSTASRYALCVSG